MKSIYGHMMVGAIALGVISERAIARVVEHVTIYREEGRFGGWPANHGIWIWGEEILTGFGRGYLKDRGPGRHHFDPDRPEEHWLARSRDGGQTWSLEHPGERGQLVPYGTALHGTAPDYLSRPEPVPLTDPMDFSAPGFAMTLRRLDNNRGPTWLFYSEDRGKNWKGPFPFPDLGTPGVAARTDYIVNGRRECFVFLTCAKPDGREGRPAVARTVDGGLNWEFVSYIGPEPEGFAIMPSTVRLPEGRLASAVRRREGLTRWIEAYASDDNGRTWQPLSVPVEDTGAGNPPYLLLLDDGRLAITYGYRREPSSIRARLSSDGGKTWGPDIILTEGAMGVDIGYTRSVQRPDGKIVTVYYFHEEPRGERFIEAAIWSPDPKQ